MPVGLNCDPFSQRAAQLDGIYQTLIRRIKRSNNLTTTLWLAISFTHYGGTTA